MGKAVGIYDIAASEGFVVVSDDGDTAEFAVASIGRWGDQVGVVAYPEATRLLIIAGPPGATRAGTAGEPRGGGLLAGGQRSEIHDEGLARNGPWFGADAHRPVPRARPPHPAGARNGPVRPR